MDTSTWVCTPTPWDEQRRPLEGDRGGGAGPDDHRRGAERRRQRRFVLRERRTGFDRRAGEAAGPGLGPSVRRWSRNVLLHLREQPLTLGALLVVMNVLSLIDLALTLAVINDGAVELNPVIKPLLEVSPWLAGLVKVLLVGTASALIWRFRRYRLVLQVALLGPAFFLMIDLYQVTFGFVLWR